MIDLTIVLTISQTPYSGASYSLLSKDNIIDFPDSVNKFHKLFTRFAAGQTPHPNTVPGISCSNTYRFEFVGGEFPSERDEEVPEDALSFGHSAAVHKSAKDAL